MSSNKQSFDAGIPPCQETLRQNVYNYKPEYNPQPLSNLETEI